MENMKDVSGRASPDVVARIMGFARLLQNLANRFKGLARFLAVSGVFSAVMLDWAASKSWGMSATLTIIMGIVLLLPGLVLGWVWYVLDQASYLPQRLASWAGQAREYAGDVVQRLQGDPTELQKPGSVFDLKQLGGLTYEISSMGMDARDLLSILGGSLSFTNPIFLLILTVAVGLIIFLDVAALLTGLIAMLA